MKRVVGSSEAKAKFFSLLKRVSKGSRFIITKKGKPIAVLSSIDQGLGEPLSDAVEAIKQLRKKYSLKKND